MKHKYPLLKLMSALACVAFLAVANSLPAQYQFDVFAGATGVSGANDGFRTDARLSNPTGIAQDAAGNLYVVATSSHTLRKITPDGQVTTLAGATGQVGSADGQGANARFAYPWGVAVAPNGTIFVSDAGNHTIRAVSPSGTVTTLAGVAGELGSADGFRTAARFNRPSSIVADAAGNLYVSDYSNSTIRKIDPSGNVTTLAGSAGQFGYADGFGSAARFNYPDGLAVDEMGDVLVVDANNHVVRRITPSGEVTTLAGVPGQAGSVDSADGPARFDSPVGIVEERPGAFLVTDRGNNTLRRLTSAGYVTTVGGAVQQSGSVNGAGTAARFVFPTGLSLSSRQVFITDTFDQTVRRGYSIFGEGIYEQAPQNFNAAAYAQRYPELAQMFGSDADAIWQYYLAAGVYRGMTDGVFDGAGYLAARPWLQNVLGNDWAAAAVHWYVYNGALSALGNAMEVTTPPGPVSAQPGEVVEFSYGVKNVGTRTWGANHFLALRTLDYALADFGDMGDTAPGGNRTVRLSLAAPSSPGTYRYRVQPLENGVEWFGRELLLDVQVTGAVVTPAGNGLTYGATNFPLRVEPGASVNFSYGVTNSGTKAWGSNHLLALREFSYAQVQMGGLSPTASGGSRTVNFSFTAPSSPGVYRYRLQPLENGVEWFGAERILTLQVGDGVEAVNGLTYGSNSFPTSVAPGASVAFVYNVTNSGTKQWGANHYLALRSFDYTPQQLVSLAPTSAGQAKQAAFNFTAPSSPGVYRYRVQPLENGVEWFGNETILTLQVGSGPVPTNALTFGSNTFPATAAAGSTVTFNFTVTNSGTTTWGANHLLALRTFNYEVVQMPSLSTTAPGGSRTVSYSFTAPSTSGVYRYRVQPLENGVEWFGSEVILQLTVP